MTGDERLAKVAEVLAGHANWSGARDPWPDTRWVCTCGEPVDENPSGVNVIARHRAHVAQALAPLLDEFRAEDEARALREAADTLWRIFLRLPHTPSPLGDYVQRKSQEFRRAALAAAEPDAGER